MLARSCPQTFGARFGGSLVGLALLVVWAAEAIGVEEVMIPPDVDWQPTSTEELKGFLDIRATIGEATAEDDEAARILLEFIREQDLIGLNQIGPSQIEVTCRSSVCRITLTEVLSPPPIIVSQRPWNGEFYCMPARDEPGVTTWLIYVSREGHVLVEYDEAALEILSAL